MKLNEFKGRNTFDVTKSKSSIAAKVEPLIGKMEKMSLDEIKAEFNKIVNDKETHASDATRAKWKDVLSKHGNNKVKLMFAISNLYLAGARLAVESKKDEGGLTHLTEFEQWNQNNK